MGKEGAEVPPTPTPRPSLALGSCFLCKKPSLPDWTGWGRGCFIQLCLWSLLAFASIQAPTIIYNISIPQHHVVPSQTEVEGDSRETKLRVVSITLYFSCHRPTQVQRETYIL